MAEGGNAQKAESSARCEAERSRRLFRAHGRRGQRTSWPSHLPGAESVEEGSNQAERVGALTT